MRLFVEAFSATSGVAIVENLSRHHKYEQNITSSYPLCGQDAEWIVEDFTEIEDSGIQELVPFANFGTVTFTNAAASKRIGFEGPEQGLIVNIKQNGTVLTSVSETLSTVTVKYTGP